MVKRAGKGKGPVGGRGGGLVIGRDVGSRKDFSLPLPSLHFSSHVRGYNTIRWRGENEDAEGRRTEALFLGKEKRAESVPKGGSGLRQVPGKLTQHPGRDKCG